MKTITLSNVRLRRPKDTCCPSRVDYHPTTNAEILWDTGHTEGVLHTGGIQQGKKTKTLNVACMLIIH
jgi:hypothetical protein